jgi:hypothetical protein
MAADDYFTNKEGVYLFDATKLGEAHASCRKKVENSMREACTTIIVHNTFTRVSEMSEYFKMALDYGYDVVSLIVENRHGSVNVHSVPENALTKMKERFDVQL